MYPNLSIKVPLKQILPHLIQYFLQPQIKTQLPILSLLSLANNKIVHIFLNPIPFDLYPFCNRNTIFSGNSLYEVQGYLCLDILRNVYVVLIRIMSILEILCHYIYGIGFPFFIYWLNLYLQQNPADLYYETCEINIIDFLNIKSQFNYQYIKLLKVLDQILLNYQTKNIKINILIFQSQFINYTSSIHMTDTEQFAKVLSNWKDHDKKKVNDVLKRIDTLNVQVQDIFAKINRPILDFHKQIMNCSTQQTDADWFANVLKIKKKLKKAEQNAKKKGAQKPQLSKKPSTVLEYPKQLFEGSRPSQESIIKMLFKNFVLNMPESSDYSKDSRVIEFVKGVNIQLRKMYEDELDTKKNKRVDSICMHLSKQGCTGAKLQMIQGKKTPRQVADDLQSAYKDQLKLRRQQQHLREQLQMAQTGRYTQMKKNIFKGASQQCRYCKQKTAYCDDMKQIRASDEPMTRFMKCNNCGKNWRD